MTSRPDVSAPKKPLRVLIAAPKYIIGGHNKQAADLIANLRDRGVDAALQPVDPLLPRPFRIRYVRTVVKLIYYTAQLLVRVPKYDVVQAYSAGMTSYLLSTLPALFVARLWRRPFLLYYADGRLAEHLASSRIAVPTMRMATVIVGASPHIRVVMAEQGLTARVIPTAVNRAIRYRARRNLQPRLMTNRLLEPLYNHPVSSAPSRGCSRSIPTPNWWWATKVFCALRWKNWRAIWDCATAGLPACCPLKTYRRFTTRPRFT